MRQLPETGRGGDVADRRFAGGDQLHGLGHADLAAIGHRADAEFRLEQGAQMVAGIPALRAEVREVAREARIVVDQRLELASRRVARSRRLALEHVPDEVAGDQSRA
jgi:hypothetical protein